MKSTVIAAAVAALVSVAPASAALVALDFDGPTSFASIAQYYAGGTDGAGVSGPDFGVTFGGDALAFQNDELGPYFSNAPTPLGVMAPVGASAAMNVAAGFSGEISFAYSSTAAAEVRVWSGLDGTGALLHTFNLASNAQSNGCSDSPFCNWNFTSIVIGSGAVAKSITFGDAAALAAFDNVTVTAVPEPGTTALMALGLAGLGGLVARRRKAVR